VGRAVVVLVVSFLAGCAGPAARPASKAPVFIISVDTLRADHLPAYGYAGVETPHLDAFRKDAVLFSEAWSPVPLTLPSHTTLLTGRQPAEHGVRDNVGYRRRPAVETLAQTLRNAGYATGGAVSSIVLAGESGMGDGFDLYDDQIEANAPNLSLGRVQRDGGATATRLSTWLSTQAGRPVFGFLHLYEPHTPYEPPEPFRSRYPGSPYDGEIAAADAVVGDFLSFLKAKGLYDPALILVLSDHGEGLGDHGEDEHGVTLYREALHVPLLVKLPASRHAGAAVTEPVGLVDVVATVAEVTGVASPAGSGRSLTSSLDGSPLPSRRIYSETLFPRLHYGWSDLASLTDGRHHYIEAPRPELYDLAADRHEKQDLSAGLPGPFRAMRIEMAQVRSKVIEMPAAVDPEQAAKLASLGYIGSTAAAADATGLPDPKDKVASLRAMKEAFSLLKDDRAADAARAFQRLVELEPKMADGWSGLSQAYRKAGDLDRSLTALKEVARLSPAGSTEHFLGIANLALEIGRTREARDHAELALRAGNSLAHETLALIALAERNLPEAAAELTEARRLHPSRRFPRLIAVRLLVRQGRLAEALGEADEILALSAREALAPLMAQHQLRADVLARLGRVDEAEAEFQEELRLFPENAEAHRNLAVLFATTGRRDKLLAALEDLVRTAPRPASFRMAAEVLDAAGERSAAASFRRRAAS